jgi:multimeric flavodoxin WrbA
LNIVSILGSPHGLAGNTGRLLELVLAGVRAEGASTETICLGAGEVRPCVACDACHKTGRCPLPDVFEELRAKIAAADGVILASPNYIFSVSAQLKAFMDRCCGTIHCLGFEGKYGAAVVTSGGGDEPIVDYIGKFQLATGIRPIGGVHATMAAQPEGAFTEGIEQQARQLSAELVRACRERRTDPEVERQMRDFRARMRELVVWRREEWPYEYAYWQDRHEKE